MPGRGKQPASNERVPLTEVRRHYVCTPPPHPPSFVLRGYLCTLSGIRTLPQQRALPELPAICILKSSTRPSRLQASEVVMEWNDVIRNAVYN